jgi:hypothetical protein
MMDSIVDGERERKVVDVEDLHLPLSRVLAIQ